MKTAGKSRSIRLKEQTPRIDVWHTPPGKYRRGTDGSLARGPFRARTDGQGFLITGNTGLRGHAVYFLGGSFVESMYADEDRRFVSQVERALRDEGPSHRCFNAGYSGATTLQLINVLVNKILPVLRPNDTVVFFVPQSDSDVVDREGGYWLKTARHAPIIPVADEKYIAPVVGPQFEQTTQLLELVQAIRLTFRINLVLVASPMRNEEPESAYYARRFTAGTSERVVALRRGLISSVRRYARSSPGLPFIDAAAMLDGHPELFYDDLHLNHEGQDQFAKTFVSALIPRLAGGSRWNQHRFRRRLRKAIQQYKIYDPVRRR
ncbi:SGNH/GDSL hydrolase family protein [Zhihengliuella salsuginis]|uniref:SGNH hydrolase-type esterase domain-containing protein n=1 Tax=Zhihengliuella salsuginis TaxID=578222 RepID=A0ABQ3GK34_9MICC|nr:SGNH/GDSL hydrolase family protein [Zhihengliuella salsuginis]GHD11844.1 hypothetical protein GCM10008096_26670 [Zhihengliuella salsuginis]